VSPAAAPPPNQPPQVSSPGNQTSAAGTTVSLQIQASDPDGGSLSYSATGLPPGLSINATTGRISGTISVSASGTYNTRVTVSDGAASANVSFTWTVTVTAPPNQPPQVSSPGNQTSAAGTTVSLQIQASDPDGGSLSYSATGLPPGLSINATTGRITGTISSSASGTYNTQVTVSDGAASANASFTWTVTVTAPPNQPPQVSSPGNQTSAAGATVSLQIQASDPDGGSLSYSATGLPPGLSINATTGRITGTVSSSASGTYNTRVTVSDGALTASASFTWTVTATPASNHPPQVTSPGNQTSSAGATVSLQIQGSDQDGDPLSYSATGLPPGLSIHSTTGEISGTVSLSGPDVYTVTVSVSDGTETDSATFSWTVPAEEFSEALHFSQFGNGTSPRWITGTEDVKLSSQITLVNLSSTKPVQAVVDIRDDDGNLLHVGLNGEPTGGSKQVVIPAAGSVFLKTDGTGDLRTGSVIVRSDRELSRAIVVGSELGRIAYADNQAVGAFLAPANQDGLGTGANAEIVRIGVSIMNLEDEETTVSLQLLDAEGRLQATGQVTLPPRGHLARFIDELTWSGVPNCNGTLRGVVEGTGRVAVAVVGVAPTGFWSLPVIPQD